MRLTLTAPAPAVAADLGDARTLTGLAVPYGVPGGTSAGMLTVDAGAVALPDDLRRVKLFREHGRTTPVGYAVEALDTAESLTMTFRAAATPDGDTALLEAAEGVRDALSVELDAVTVTDGHITAGNLVGVALTSIPAFADARITAADHPDPAPEEPAMTNPAAPPTETPPVVEASLIPAGITTAPRSAAVTASQGIEQVRQAIRGASDASQVNAALSDVIPANDGGPGYLRPQWLGELWTPVAAVRNYVPSIGSAALTGLKVQGWKWATTPVVGDYAGNKSPIPSNAVSIVPAEEPAWRLAGGWDVDRAYVDLAEAGFLEAMFAAAVADYGVKSSAKVGAALLAEATPKTATSVYDALAVIGMELGALGTTPSFIALASDLWAPFYGAPAAEVPWWLASSSSVSVSTGSASVSDVKIFVDPALPSGTVLGGARQAATFYEAKPAPLRVQALNIPNGGIDIAVFGYGAVIVNDPRGVIAVTAPVIP